MSIFKANTSLDSPEIFSSVITNSKEWKILKLEDVLELITYGLTVRPKYVEQGIPLLSATQIKDYNINFLSAPRISLDDYNNLSDKCKLRIGDILFSKTGTIGSCAICNQEQEIAIAQNVARLVFDKKIVDLGYAFYYLRSPLIQNLSKERAKGNAIKDLQLGEIRKFPIPLPPLEEQKRIAAILDKADRVRRKRQEAIRLTEELGRSIFLDMFGDPVINPKGWEMVTIGDIVTDVRDGPHVSPKYSDEGIPILSTRNIRPGQLLIDDIKHISNETYLNLVRKFKPQFGDVLLTKGGTTGFAKVVDWKWPFAIWLHLACLRPTTKVLPDFLEAALNSPNCYSQSQKYTHGIANRDLGLKRIIKIKLSLPPIDLQEKYCILNKKITDQKLRNASLLEESENLFNSLLQRAFRGEL